LIKIGGVQWTSLIDYPEQVCTTLFTIGCNFRCPYCYNRSLVLPEEYPPLNIHPTEKVLDRLKSRKDLVSAVTITGGEPTLQKNLPDFLKILREMEFKIKIDTNGTAPDMIQEILRLNLADFIAMDYKAPSSQYDELVGMPGAYELVAETLKILTQPKIEVTVEVRTTFPPPLLETEDIVLIAKELRKQGVKRYALQTAADLGSGFIIPQFKLEHHDSKALKRIVAEISPWFETFILREN
jgi:pyruvate formate lyase activating enzyme